MLNIDVVAAGSLASVWLVSTVAALLPSKRITLSDSKLSTSSQNEGHLSQLSKQQEIREKHRGEIIFEAQFKHKVSRARILLSLFGLILLLSRVLQSGYGYMMKDDLKLIQFESADALIWLNLLILSFNLTKTLSYRRCLHLLLLPSASLLFQLLLLVAPPDIFQTLNFSPIRTFKHNTSSISIVAIVLNSFFFSLSCVVWIVASTIPLGPRREYSPKPGSIPAKEVTNLSSDGASLLDRILFSYCFRVVNIAKKNGKLTEEDIPFLDAGMKTEVLGTDFELYLQDEKRKSELKDRKKKKKVEGSASDKPSPWPLVKSLIRSNRFVFWFITVSAPFMAISFYASAICLNRIVHFLEVNEQSSNPEHFSATYKLQQGGVWCVALALSAIGGGVFQNLYFSYVGELVVRIKAQLNTSIFAKTLRKKDVNSGSKSSAVAEDAEGGSGSEEKKGKGEEEEEDFKSKAQVIQLSSVDCQRVSQFSMHYFMVVLFPCELLVGGTFIYKLLGISALIGISVSIITAPITSYVAKQKGGIQKKLQVQRDKRVSILNESFAAIRMIKFAAWEQKIQDKVLKFRSLELFYQRLSFIIDTILGGLFVMTPNLSILVTFGWFVFVQGETLKPSIAFSAISVLLELRYLLSHVPELISSIVTSWVSLRRIAVYLGSEEVDVSEYSSDGIVAIRSATIGWPIERSEAAGASGTSTPAAGPFKLRDINVEFDQGKLNLIAGRLGSGKSLLLLALLHEAEISSGHIQAPRSAADAIKGDKFEIVPPSEWIRKDLVAYTPQSAFLTNASIKDNILFGLPLDNKRYQETITACQLRPDLDQLEDGDETEIGENGIGLSGGQKTRVSIARSFYSRASTLLLDDVLSAVDASTASRLVSDLLVGDLARGRTIILVSHQVQLCAPIASKLVLLNDEGRIGFDGSADSFLKSDLYAGLHEEEIKGESVKTSDSEATTLADQDENSKAQVDSNKPKEDKATPKKLVKDEKIGEGSIKFSVYLAYLREGGVGLWIATVIFFVVVNSWPGLTAAWLREWSMDSIRSHRQHIDLWYWQRLGALYGAEVLLSVISSLLLFNASLRASNRFFKLMLNSVFGATLRFHDTVSRGRLLNRFGSDFESLDEELADALKGLITNVLDLILHVSIVWITNGLSFVILFAILLPSYVWVGISFNAATRDLRRIESATKSPVMSAFSDLVSGVTVIRSFGNQSHILDVLTERSDASTNSTWYRMMLSRWMNILFDLSSTFLTLFSALYILIQEDMSAATAGFALSFLINVFSRLLFTTVRFADVQQRLVSVERIVEFATELDSEPPSIMESVPNNWPQGEIVAKDLSLRYAPELPEVLKKVNFTIQRGQKVALVGSTGSGKTSLATALFRFTDPSNGSIKIDGIDITQVGLQDLRSRMQIVPQDPTILSGPLRNSIDVFDEHTDGEVFQALRAVQLIGSSTSPSAAVSIHEGQAQDPEETNANVFRDLSYPIAEGGSNLSNGQRQLICLARAMLKKASIIVFDEATSSIDNETEEILSATIREAFANATVLTIAHRLRTIANYDLVMVMDQGSIVEMDSPGVLLTRPSSKFFTLCQAAGQAEFTHLKKLAGLV